jgi:hypothetical protein
MNSRQRPVAALAVVAIAILCTCLSGTVRAQPSADSSFQCPEGQHWCHTEGGLIFCGDCSDPDSSSIESDPDSSSVASDPDSSSIQGDKLTTVVVSKGMTVSGISSALNAPAMASAAMGAMFEAAVHSSSAQLADVQLQAQEQGKWIVSSRPVGSGPAQKTTFKVMSGRSSVASLSGSSAVAEISAFPSHFSVATTKAGTTLTWAFKEPVEIGVGATAASIGARHRGNALSVTVPNGSANGLSRLDLKRRGTGPISFANTKATMMSVPTGSH